MAFKFCPVIKETCKGKDCRAFHGYKCSIIDGLAGLSDLESVYLMLVEIRDNLNNLNYLDRLENLESDPDLMR